MGGLAPTVTWNSHVATLPAASVSVQVTSVVPRGKWLPEGGSHTSVGVGSCSSLARTE